MLRSASTLIASFLLLLTTAGSSSAQLITSEDLAALAQLKGNLYRSLTNSHANGVLAGTAQPGFYVEVGGGDVPVSYTHFTVSSGQVAALAAAIPLPSGFTLAPVRVVQGETPVETITLTVYEVGGERSGLRAEWTTYVLAPGETDPRVMMIETATSEASLDPVDIDHPAAATFGYAETAGVVDVQIVSGGSSYTASLPIPDPATPAQVIDSSWGATADVIYWRNGVFDLHNVNGLIANREVVSVPPASVTITDGTPWAAFVDATPRHVLLFDERIDAVIQPWVNADDAGLGLDPVFQADLVARKASDFSTIEFVRAADINARTAEPIADFFVEQAPPSVYMNFEVIPGQEDALAAAIPLPFGFELAPIQTVRGQPARYFLSLNFYETVGIASGKRAEWSVYVTHIDDPTPRYMVIEAQSDAASLDPVNLFTEPATVFTYEEVGGVLSLDVQEGGTSFQTSFPLPASPQLVDTTLSWAEANSLIYWRNGVADKIYYNGLIYDEPVVVVPNETVTYTDATPWAPYLQLHEVLVYENQLEFLASPWNNTNALVPEPGAMSAFVALLATLGVLNRSRSLRRARSA